ncbi:acyl-CoA carboxylase epsilon subunit [Streptomyces sp. NBC_01408]|uniref:acyl-CoA carboxylase epsilon subunit n=1 Tax=Streptomyces sp. NBC_01408 TaxID=2903855 RepID=UPI00225720D0|nr:acyl-CoA carboxylase epsilon subunit [Streptomyces sp. NBC_01408]MCX4691372.1 acyl-CoA carboxylase epsilon subunit [Streptomyces sp. NBC_01408]
MVIKVVKGNPTPEELAAALAVVQARAAALASQPSGAQRVADEWSAPARVARHRLPQPGPRAWGRTYWPG